MDYFRTAFGGFSPHRDEDAAVKFVLNAVLMDHRVEELAELVVDGSQLGGIEGEPGWMLEGRDAADEGNEAAYPGWPAGARFKASVDEDAYTLQHPKFFMSRETFIGYLAPALEAYVEANPSTATAPSVIALRKAMVS